MDETVHEHLRVVQITTNAASNFLSETIIKVSITIKYQIYFSLIIS